MPHGQVKTAADEEKWNKAKAIVAKEYPKVKTGSKRYWKLVSGIYQDMRHKDSAAKALSHA